MSNQCDVKLSELEIVKAKSFEKKHRKKCMKHRQERFTIRGYYTGIGAIIKIKCPICGQVEDITDVGSW